MTCWAVRHGNLEAVKWAYERGAGGIQSVLGYIIIWKKSMQLAGLPDECIE